MSSVADVMQLLQADANPENLKGMARFGINVENRLGLSVPQMRSLAKQVGRDHALALELWKTGIAEARIVAAMIDDPARVTARQMDRWVKDFDSWDVCDQVCLTLFDKTPLAWSKISLWSVRKPEFVRRAAYALVAGLAWHDKTAPDQRFRDLFPVLKLGAHDERVYVKKAVSWALRNIGKRNAALHRAALQLAQEIRQVDSKAARWIASDVTRELESEAVRARLRPAPNPRREPVAHSRALIPARLVQQHDEIA